MKKEKNSATRKIIIQVDVDGVIQQTEMRENDIDILANYIFGTVEGYVKELDKLEEKFYSTDQNDVEALNDIFEDAGHIEDMLVKYEGLNDIFSVAFDEGSEYFEPNDEVLIDTIENTGSLGEILRGDDDGIVTKMYRIVEDLKYKDVY